MTNWISKNFSTRSESGFVLLEAAILTIVIGIITSLAFSLYSFSKKATEAQLTEHCKTVITKMLAGYLLENAHLPYAATTSSNGRSSQGILDGLVPYRTLGLPKKFAISGSGRPIRYIVAAQFANTSSLREEDSGLGMGESDSFCQIATSEILVTSPSGETVSDSPICFILATEEGGLKTQAFGPVINGPGISWVSKNMLTSVYANFSCTPIN